MFLGLWMISIGIGDRFSLPLNAGKSDFGVRGVFGVFGVVGCFLALAFRGVPKVILSWRSDIIVSCSLFVAWSKRIL